ncbi:MAG: S-layer homology domain-containing protein [Actinomycetota bacterium]
MILPQRLRSILAGAVLGGLVSASVFVIAPAGADDTFDFAPIHAPFECGSEWSGTTRPGHGLNDWNLDMNRTSRTFSDPQHDLGQPLLAQADGTIVWIGWHVSAGTYVEIDYGEITARYIHVVDDSVPDHLEIGSRVTSGELFGLLGDTGNATSAHLHLEYFDSRDYDDARAWLLPDSNQIRIRMNGEIIDPGEVFVSTNCDGTPPTTTTTVPPPHPFVDVDPSSFAYLDVALLHEMAITTGTSDTTYSPGDPVDREQMAAFLARVIRTIGVPAPEPAPELAAEETPSDDESPDDDASADEPSAYPFADVDPSSFAYEDIALLHELEITTGTGPDAYSPADDVDREQMAAFLARVLRLLDPSLDEPVDPVTEDLDDLALAHLGEAPFEDVDPESFAAADIEFIWRLNVTTGTSESTYSPADDVDREQMAAFLARVLRLLDPSLDEPVDPESE